jgi:FtsP/CotA-like multicopper oxidase with cupredoxin domain
LIGKYTILTFFGKAMGATHNPNFSGVILQGGTPNGNGELPFTKIQIDKQYSGQLPKPFVLIPQIYVPTMEMKHMDHNMESSVYDLGTMGHEDYFLLSVNTDSVYCGFIDGFLNDNFFNFSVIKNSTENRIYYNMDSQDSHVHHFHLTSGYAFLNQLCVNDTDLYSKDSFSIPPQQSVQYYVSYPNFYSKDGKVKNLGYMYHCHLMGHHDMNMMGQYYVKNHCIYI